MNTGHWRHQLAKSARQCELRAGCFKRQKLHEVFSGHMLAHDRPLVHGRGALGSPHGHAPSFAANTGPREVTSSAAPREHAPAGGREGEVYRPSYAARALVWVRWTRGAPWFGRCSRGAAQLEARRGEHLHYAQPRVLVGPPSRRGRGCILLVILRACVLRSFKRDQRAPEIGVLSELPPL